MPPLTPLPCPSEREVHIFCAAPVSKPDQYLSSDEILRASRIIDPVKREQFLAGRAYLRSTLRRYLQVPEQDINFQIGVHGKPTLSRNITQKNNLFFNQSHSGPLLLLAISTTPDIGIDLEQILHDTPINDMARLAFSPREQAELAHYQGDQRITAFYRCWTRKEAFLKGCGKGFARQSSSFDVSLLPAPIVKLRVPDTQECWCLQDVTVPDGYSASLAIHPDAATIKYFQ